VYKRYSIGVSFFYLANRLLQANVWIHGRAAAASDLLGGHPHQAINA